MAYARDGRWEESEKSFHRAIEIDPRSSTPYGNVSTNLLLPLGRIQEALHHMRVAEKLDPLSPFVNFHLALVLLAAGRYDEAVGYCEKLPADHSLKSDCLGRARLGQGRSAEAIQILAKAGDRGFLGYAYARAGRREEAEKLAARGSLDAFNQALIFAGLGDKDRTLEALERMAPLGPVRIGRTLSYPELALLRGDPRVTALRKKVGLPQ